MKRILNFLETPFVNYFDFFPKAFFQNLSYQTCGAACLQVRLMYRCLYNYSIKKHFIEAGCFKITHLMLLLEVVQTMDQAKEKVPKVQNIFIHIFHHGPHTS